MEEVVVRMSDDCQRAEEPWAQADASPEWYTAQVGFASKTLGSGEGRTCLVVGSPLFESQALAEHGWKVGHFDWREPPWRDEAADHRWFVRGDAMHLPFSDGSFDAVSSTCLLCHVGLGRYGDPEAERGDKIALREFARVLKSGGRAAIMFGPALAAVAQTIRMGDVHRLYGPVPCLEMMAEAGLTPLKWSMYDVGRHRWLNVEEVQDDSGKLTDRIKHDEHPEELRVHHNYFSALMEKQE